jgi:hypothetical protein
MRAPVVDRPRPAIDDPLELAEPRPAPDELVLHVVVGAAVQVPLRDGAG